MRAVLAQGLAMAGKEERAGSKRQARMCTSWPAPSAAPDAYWGGGNVSVSRILPPSPGPQPSTQT